MGWKGKAVRILGFVEIGIGVAMILTLSMFYILFGIFFVTFGYYSTRLSIWNFIFKSQRDNSIGETK